MAEYALEGPWRRPANTSANEKGGIHDDATAQDLGFAGGTVAGSIHMEQFPPFLLRHLGDAWLETGTISLYFRAATLHGEPVRCVGGAPVRYGSLTRMPIGMLDEAGTVVMDGTASIGGPDAASALRRKVAQARPADDLRVLGGVRVDHWCDPIDVRIPDEGIERQLAVITEPMAMFGAPGDASRVPPLSTLIHALRGVESTVIPTRGDFVGLFGAIEIAYGAGQPVTGEDYRVIGRVLALSASPKTEIVWSEAVLSNASDGVERVRMVKMDRIMKASSPLWSAE